MINGQKKLDWINEQISWGRTITFQTALKAWEIDGKTLKSFEKHGGLFKVDSAGSLWMRRGKSWDCMDGARLACQVDA